MEQRPHFQCFHPHKPQWQEAPKPQERLHVAFATTNQLQVKSAQWCLRSSGYPGRVGNTGLDSWLGPYLPGDQARLHRKRGITIRGSVRLTGNVRTKGLPNKKHDTSVINQKNVSVTAGKSQMSFLPSATAEPLWQHILAANEEKRG